MRIVSLIPAFLLLAALPPVLCAQTATSVPGPLIVIGFMGGNVHASNLIHREAVVARELQQAYPQALHAAVYANREEVAAIRESIDDDIHSALLERGAQVKRLRQPSKPKKNKRYGPRPPKFGGRRTTR